MRREDLYEKIPDVLWLPILMGVTVFVVSTACAIALVDAVVPRKTTRAKR